MIATTGCYYYKECPWESSEEEQAILSQIKNTLRNITYIPQESIKVTKGFGSFFLGSRKKVQRRYMIENVTAPDWGDRLAGSSQNLSYIGYFYQVQFQVGTKIGHVTRSVNVVTKVQYLQGLKFLKLASLVKEFENQRDVGFFYLNTTHCEEGPGRNHYLPSPLDVPIGLDVWAATKLLQRLGNEGIQVDLGGIITLVPTQNKLERAQKFLGRIDNQGLKYTGRRVF